MESVEEKQFFHHQFVSIGQVYKQLLERALPSPEKKLVYIYFCSEFRVKREVQETTGLND